jgi:NAD(P)-dependent dehydrogenase (short-subunit alcohol dehydrogenase family)
VVRSPVVSTKLSSSFAADRSRGSSMDYRNAFDLTGSVAVISGGSRGIGYESAVALGSCGSKVILASRDRRALNTAVKRLAETGIDAACTVVDVIDPAAVTKVADAIVAEHGKIDILVNSAGVARLNSAIETPDDEWRAVMDVNVNGLFWCCRAFGRHMIARHTGSIINLGSMSGLIVPSADRGILHGKQGRRAYAHKGIGYRVGKKRRACERTGARLRCDGHDPENA